MLYVNQLKHPHIRYEHNVDNGGVPFERQRISTSGCGLCSACMVVEHLTVHTLSLEECVQLSYDSHANGSIGTALGELGPLVAEKFGLTFERTDDMDKMIACLQAGGEAIINVGGDDEKGNGVFTHGGHYIVAVSYENGEFCLLDPSYREDKFDKNGNAHKVRVREPFIYCSRGVLEEEALAKRKYPLYLFKRK